MAKKPSISYICSECGYKSATKYGKCPNCKSFGTMEDDVG